MKKTLGLLALAGGAAALVAYTLKKKEEQKNIVEANDEILDAEGNHDDVNVKASLSTASYPNLNEEDMGNLNDICDKALEGINLEEITEEKAIQHVLHFESEKDLEDFKQNIIHEGYVVTNGQYENDLLVLHVSKISEDLVFSKVFYLANKAKEYNGAYLNWMLK